MTNTGETDPSINGTPAGSPGPPPEEPSDWRGRRLGLTLVILGSSIILLWCLNEIEPLPIPLPRTFYLHRTLWGAIGMALAATGWWLQRDRRQTGPPDRRSARDGWIASRPGVRFQSVVLYSREGCHLCDDVKDLLAEYEAYLPEICEIDIDEDAGLRSRFGLVIPVVEIDGRERFRGKIDVGLLRRLIDATPPIGQFETHGN